MGSSWAKTDLIAVNDVDRNEIIHAFHVSLRFITSPFFLYLLFCYNFNNIFKSSEKKERTQAQNTAAET